MLKLIYYAYGLSVGSNSIDNFVGVKKKIASQIRELSTLNINVQLITTGRFTNSNTHNKLVLYFLKLIESSKLLIATEMSLQSKDIIYLRYPYPLLYVFYIMVHPNKRCIFISEHNTIELSEYKLNSHASFSIFLLYINDLYFGKLSRKYSDAFVCVTDEIANYELSIIDDYKKPHISIGNGINVLSINLRTPPVFSNVLNLIFVANLSKWHGIDRLIRGLAHYDGTPEVILHIVGKGKEMSDLTRLSKKYHLTNKVIFHGFLDGIALDSLFDICHIAVGSLGIHRKGLRMTSELKIREYTARGIPFICSAIDQDIPSDFIFMLKFESNEDFIDIYKIIKFAETIYSDPNHHVKMREYAEKNLDWSVKMNKLNNFLNYIVSKKDNSQ